MYTLRCYNFYPISISMYSYTLHVYICVFGRTQDQIHTYIHQYIHTYIKWKGFNTQGVTLEFYTPM